MKNFLWFIKDNLSVLFNFLVEHFVIILVTWCLVSYLFFNNIGTIDESDFKVSEINSQLMNIATEMIDNDYNCDYSVNTTLPSDNLVLYRYQYSSTIKDFFVIDSKDKNLIQTSLDVPGVSYKLKHGKVYSDTIRLGVKNYLSYFKPIFDSNMDVTGAVGICYEISYNKNHYVFPFIFITLLFAFCFVEKMDRFFN